ncbi:hypothetical protein QTO34_001788 [Cnephaeus nilssonii]|uniref:DUF1279 domain-containing protein n=1 Tax=Cnephaeus nilssonii TaxID=3371016 RepID=A0AA40HTJ1_CNENI|nr:hypothetical protein QTO34_001788 [Eptesicus nilssonii]
MVGLAAGLGTFGDGDVPAPPQRLSKLQHQVADCVHAPSLAPSTGGWLLASGVCGDPSSHHRNSTAKANRARVCSPAHSARVSSSGHAHPARLQGSDGAGSVGGASEGARASRPRPRRSGLRLLRGPALPARFPSCRLRDPSASPRTMARLLVLLGPAGRISARVGPRASWLLGAAGPCAPPPLFLPLLRPGPDARLLCAARGDSGGRQNPSKATATTASGISSAEERKQSKSQQLKKVFQEYGAVGVSVHIGISLVSLGMFYMVVSSGVDMSAILLKLGFKESLVQSKMAAGTSTFVVAYAIHKLFAPVRISITLVSVPLLVRYFRKVGFFKPPLQTLDELFNCGPGDPFLLNYTIRIGSLAQSPPPLSPCQPGSTHFCGLLLSDYQSSQDEDH